MEDGVKAVRDGIDFRNAAECGRQAVRELVLQQPTAARVLERFGIDYCCAGTRPLAEACHDVGCSVEELIRALETSTTDVPERDWRAEPLEDLIAHIVEKHHSFTRGEIKRLAACLAKVVSVHGRNHPELLHVQRTMAVLSTELLDHMDKEERLLFPYVVELEEAVRFSRRPPEPIFGTVQNPIAAMVMEHEASGQALDTVREVTKNYALPPEACATFQELYRALPAFAADLHQHIHLENNILFPRAIEVEEALMRNAR
jgi:regulator of cell morphogenesis and NO signaling